jgi:delta-1-pyrroline-5-carboxylate synthetase
MACTVELVAGLEEAVEHIHKYGSSHTEVIVTEDAAAADRFLAAVDSACVFHNVSSRWGGNFFQYKIVLCLKKFLIDNHKRFF